MSVYALIKRSSKYFSQNPATGKPFPVTFYGTDGFVVVGNSNQYRLSDVYLFVRPEGVCSFLRIN